MSAKIVTGWYYYCTYGEKTPRTTDFCYKYRYRLRMHSPMYISYRVVTDWYYNAYTGTTRYN